MEDLAKILLGAAAAGLVSYLFRQRERREDQARHERELAQARAETAVAGQRERQLEALIQTRRKLAALLVDAGAIVAGEGATRPGSYGADAYPRASEDLVGDSGALVKYYTVLAGLNARPPGSGIRASDAQAMADADTGIQRALAAQEARLLAGEPMRTLTADELVVVGEAIKAALPTRRLPPREARLDR